MDKDDLLERYEALGEDDDFLAAKPLFEAEIRRRERSEPGLHGPEDALLLRQYGYLLECYGRITIRRAIEQYERAIALDPDADKVRYQWIGAKASLGEPETAVDLHRERVAAAPGNVRDGAAAVVRATWQRMIMTQRPTSSPLASSSPPATRGLPTTGARSRPAGAIWRVRSPTGGAHMSSTRRISAPVYSSAFLLEREGRLVEAAETWLLLATSWTRPPGAAGNWRPRGPGRELQRVLGLPAERKEPGG